MGQEKKRGEAERTFERTLLGLIGLAQGARSRTVPAMSSGSSQTQLRQNLERLEPEAALKVRTLMVAGRDGRDVATVRLETTLGESEAAFSAAARDASENGALLAEYLRRGHALACAAGIDLEKPLAAWALNHAATLDERAWLSFGRQLAKSEPDDWQFLGCVEPGGQEIVRLYVKLPDSAWWSFQALLDRPSNMSVSKETRALAGRRTKGVMASSLKTLAARLRSAPVPTGKSSPPARSKSSARQGKALQRAARAIRARVGESSLEVVS